MLLYMTTDERVNLLDFTESMIGQYPKKFIGRFLLMNFIVRDMRNFTHIKYMAIDRSAVIEDDAGFIEAIKSFQMMNTARIIVLFEGLGRGDLFMRELVTLGVVNIVTAIGIDEIQSEITECLSPDGMIRYKSQTLVPEPSAIAVRQSPATPQYRFTAKNVRIAVAGCQRRVGATTTAVNLASWIHTHGGTACYMEVNTHNHLSYIVKLYEAPLQDNHYTLGDVDYYFTDELDRSYNFIISDCGVLSDEPQSSFVNADVRLLCGSAMPYELGHLTTAVKRCKFEVQTIGMYVPEDIRLLIERSVGNEVIYADASHDLFDGAANDTMSKAILKRYIQDTGKGL